MASVMLTVTESKCRCGLCEIGDQFIVGDICPPICHELWNSIYPMVYTLMHGGYLDCGDGYAKCFDAECPDSGRVCIHGEVLQVNEDDARR